MTIAAKVTTVAATIALALPVAAMAQFTGQSHPDDSPILNMPDAATAPTPAAVSLKPRPEIPYSSTPEAAGTPSFKVIGAAVAATPADEITLTTRDAAGKSDPDAGIVTEVAGPANQLPLGTMLKVRLAQNISTESTAAGTVFTAQLIDPVLRHGRVLLPAGSTLSGTVAEVHGGKRLSGAASVHLRASTVTLPDGTRYQVRAQVIDTSLFANTRVDREGTIIRKDHAGKTAATFALTTGSGAAAGAVFGGVPGALIGAGVGAGVSTVVWLKQDRQIELPGETRIVFSLQAPLTVGGE